MKHRYGIVRRFAGLLLAVLLLLGLIPLAGCGGSKAGSGAQSPVAAESATGGSSLSGDSGGTAGTRSAVIEDSDSADEQDAAVAEKDDEEQRSDLAAVSDDEADASELADANTVEEADEDVTDVSTDTADEAGEIDEHGSYTSKEEVALYLHTYGHLPENYITKKQAEKLGWDNRAGNLQDVAPGKSIGGSRFGNYEGLLPDAKGRNYYECDINYEGGYRGAERIIYSDDGLIFYTADHYKSFEQLY